TFIKTMETSNESSTTDFILLGFSQWPKLELIFSVLALFFYIVILVGNTTIILVSYLDPQLHTPMYFFLSNLSFLDLCYTNSIIPQMLVNLWNPKKSITYGGCVLQALIALDLGGTECLLLAVMAYDRYAAVCQPLHYTVIMHPQFCQKMVLTTWLGTLGCALIVSSLAFKLPRCGHRELDNFFCEVIDFVKTACVYSQVLEISFLALSVIFLLLPLSVILISYGVITHAVMRIKSASRWHKIFNTCGSHLTVVTLFFGTVISMYLKPQNNTTSRNGGKFIALIYTIVTPSLNPLIYSLRNKDVKNAVRKILWVKKWSAKPPHLHTPMYFFLSNLSFVDLCYTNSIVPQMLIYLWSPKKSTTYGGCMFQSYFSLEMGATECLLLAVMAYDRYAAVCQPLHYTVIMHPQLCQRMVVTSWLGGLGCALILCSLTLQLPRCGNRNIDNFFCEITDLFKMACIYSKIIEIVFSALSVIFLLLPLLLIFTSYGVITHAVMRIKSASRWRKILNTCGSHLTVVALFYGTLISVYLMPQKNSTSQNEGKFITLFYTIITPGLNPLIYSLRNKDVKNAVKKMLC
ncbi:Olfactory receptor 2W1, partial [Galemys pyrenaicus]